MSKKVAIDARMISMSGIGTYIQNIASSGVYDIALGKKAEIEKYLPNIKFLEYDAPIYGVKEQLKFPYGALKNIKPEILHIPHYNVPIFYRGKMYVTIHDLTHIILPEILPNKFAYIYARLMIGIAVHKAEKIFTVSENTKKDILKYYKINPKKIIVTYNGVDSEKFRRKTESEYEYLYDKYSIPIGKKKLMYVGNLKPHKNLKRLLEAIKRLKNGSEFVLILVGKAFKSHDILKIEEEVGIQSNIIHTGIVTDNELVDFYNIADLFVFPSLYEGFGIPPLEAMACGTPVVCSNTSSMPEVVGDAALMFDPTNINDIARKIELIMSDTSLYKKMISLGFMRARLFDWKKTKEVFLNECYK